MSIALSQLDHPRLRSFTRSNTPVKMNVPFECGVRLRLSRGASLCFSKRGADESHEFTLKLYKNLKDIENNENCSNLKG